MQLEHICQQAMELIKAVGQWQLAEQQRVRTADVEVKAHNSLVSYVDKESERRLVAGLLDILPQSTFLTEERTVAARTSAQQWIIDPLDGTTNYLHGLPCFGISVALQLDGALVAGLVYDPPHDELFVAWRGGGAWCNGQRITVRANKQLAQALLATGFPYYDYSLLGNYLRAFKHFVQHTRGVRRWGAAAIDLAWTACGRFDGFFEYSLNPWDVAAGIVLVCEAGGYVSDFHGYDRALDSGQILAASPTIHRAMLEVLCSAFSTNDA